MMKIIVFSISTAATLWIRSIFTFREDAYESKFYPTRAKRPIGLRHGHFLILEMIMISKQSIAARLIAFCEKRSFGSFFKFGPINTVAKTIAVVAAASLGASIGASAFAGTPIVATWELALAIYTGILAAVPGLAVHTIALILKQNLPTVTTRN